MRSQQSDGQGADYRQDTQHRALCWRTAFYRRQIMGITVCAIYGLGLGAIMAGKSFGGAWIPDALLAHTNKTYVATLPQTTRMTCIEICGGITETGCMPSYIDMKSPLYGDHMYKAMAGAGDAETRTKMARLVEWLCVGGGIPGCHHGGGSPDTARMVIKGATNWESYVNYAKDLANVDRALLVEEKKK